MENTAAPYERKVEKTPPWSHCWHLFKHRALPRSLAVAVAVAAAAADTFFNLTKHSAHANPDI